MPVPPLLLYATVYIGVHCAYKVVFAVIIKVFPSTYGVPLPSAAVFHPAKIYPVFDNAGEPLFPKTVTVENSTYGESPSIGAVPPVLVLPSYVTVYIGVHCAYSRVFVIIVNVFPST